MKVRRLRLVWPREVSADQVAGAMRLLASTAGTPVVLEAIGQRGIVEHRFYLPDERSNNVVRQLHTVVPGIGIEGVEPDSPAFTLALNLRLSTRRRALNVDRREQVSQALLSAIGGHGRDEAVLLQWVLTDRLAPAVIPSRIGSLPSESFIRAVLTAPFGMPSPADAETRSAMKDKQSDAGWRAIGRVAVRAASVPRARQLAWFVVHALRIAEAPGVKLSAKPMPTRHVSRVRRRGQLRLNVDELATVCGWPIGETVNQPVVRLGSRRLPTPAAVPRSGRVVGESTWPGGVRPLALTPEDSLRHLHLLGPTGTGKSTVMLNLIGQDISAGRGVVVLDSKGDLIADVLARIPDRRRDDVVVLDPTDSAAVAGVNPLAGDAATADVRADQLLEVLHGLYLANWGPRTSYILGAALLTLARVGGMSLPAIPLLLTNPTFRRRVVGRVGDPVGLDGFWASFEAWSDAERTTAIAPVLNKLRPFLVRPNLRRVVGQPRPRFRMSQIFTERKVLLVNLAKGRIGTEASALLGALVMAQLWQTIQHRSSIPADKRYPVFVYLDEFQDYLSLPTNLADALAQARGLGVGFTLAHQHLGQLPTSMKSAVLANARSRICFQLGHDDARVISGTSTILGAEDFVELDTYHYYAQLTANGAVQAWCSGQSLAPSKPSADAQDVRRRSRERYATPVDDIDSAIEALLVGTPTSKRTDTDDLAPRRRAGGRS